MGAVGVLFIVDPHRAIETLPCDVPGPLYAVASNSN